MTPATNGEESTLREVGQEEEPETGSCCEARGSGSLPSALTSVTVGVCVSPGVALVDPSSAVHGGCSGLGGKAFFSLSCEFAAY